ncbi:MAG TPA: hypothetical protein VF587_05225 [Solirubrobacteraceae bacterium]|jgi:hypothetical protein
MRPFPGVLRAAVAAATLLLAAAPAAPASHQVHELVTTGPAPHGTADGAQVVWTSEDAETVLFVTAEGLVDQDDDGAEDVYRRAGTTTTLVTPGTSLDIDFGTASADGAEIVFSTDEALTDGDDDGSQTDVYRHDGATITLASDNDDGNADGAFPARFLDASPDLGRVFFYTLEPLDPAVDQDGNRTDAYVRDGSAIVLLTRSDDTPDTATTHEQDIAVSPDGTTVFWSTTRKIDPGDDDSYADIYLRAGGTTTMLTDRVQAGDDADAHAGLLAVSDDGTKMLFTTDEPLVEADENDLPDVYLWTASGVRLITSGTTLHASIFDAATPDLGMVAFETSEALTSDDLDDDADLYVTTTAGSPVTTLVSRTASGDPSPVDGLLLGLDFAADDFGRIFFTTTESLVAADDDGGDPDVYERAGAAISLVTTGPAAATDHPDFYANVEGVGTDGTVALSTEYPLTADDDDGADDVYVRRDGVTSLVADTSEETSFEALSADGATLVFSTVAALTSDDEDGLEQDAYAAREAVHEEPGPGQGSGDDGGDDGGGGDDAGGTPPPGGPSGPVPPGPGTLPNTPADVTRPVLTLSATRSQRARRGIRVRVRSSEAGAATARVAVKVGRRTVRSRRVRAALAAGRATTLVLRFGARDLARLTRGLGGRRVTARITVTVVDAAGNAATKTLAVRLRR